VTFTADDLVVELADGRRLSNPRLRAASTAERAAFDLQPTGIHWPALDEDLSVVGMLRPPCN
uniref:DUF2442 domain-containing protein n=1 Tax=Klebsiella aerogenes TaxID=548 RepID=UPI0013D290FB